MSGKLQPHQFCIKAPILQGELLMVSLLNNLSAFKDEDAVHLSNRGQPVRNDDGGAPLH